MCRLLVADDDPHQLYVRKLLLEAAGHEVTTAADVPAAVRMLQDGHPDVLVMDLRIPDLEDGLILIRSVHEQRLPSRIIVLSGWTEQLAGLPEAKLVSAVLEKPFRTEVLLEAIRALS